MFKKQLGPQEYVWYMGEICLDKVKGEKKG